jgi:hypothetical protein
MGREVKIELLLSMAIFDVRKIEENLRGFGRFLRILGYARRRLGAGNSREGDGQGKSENGKSAREEFHE